MNQKMEIVIGMLSHKATIAIKFIVNMNKITNATKNLIIYFIIKCTKFVKFIKSKQFNDMLVGLV